MAQRAGRAGLPHRAPQAELTGRWTPAPADDPPPTTQRRPRRPLHSALSTTPSARRRPACAALRFALVAIQRTASEVAPPLPAPSTGTRCATMGRERRKHGSCGRIVCRHPVDLRRVHDNVMGDAGSQPNRLRCTRDLRHSLVMSARDARPWSMAQVLALGHGRTRRAAEIRAEERYRRCTRPRLAHRLLAVMPNA